MIASGRRFRFSVGGAETGFFINKPNELRAAWITALQARGLRVLSLALSTTTIFLDKDYQYVADLHVETTAAFNSFEDVRQIVAGTIWTLTDDRPVVTSPTIGEPAQPRLSSSSGLGFLSAVTLPLAFVAVIVAAGAFVVLKAK